MSNPEKIEINGATYVLDGCVNMSDMVIVRARDAGVHIGTVMSEGNVRIRLANARRIHRWRGANTLNEMSLRGVDSAAESGYTRVSEPVPEIRIVNHCEVIPVTEVAAKSICSAGWAK